MLRVLFKSVFVILFLFSGCQAGQVTTLGDSPEGGTTAPANMAVQVIPSVTDSEVEQYAMAVVLGEEEGVDPENIDGMEPFLDEVDLSRDRYIQIKRGVQLDATIASAIEEKIIEIKNKRAE